MTIAQKGTFHGNLDENLNTAINKAEKDAHDAVKNDKPSLYKHIATTYIQWGAIGLTMCFIVYKMFIADIIKQQSAKRKALMVQAVTKSAPAAANVALPSASGKGSISKDTKEIKTIGDVAKDNSSTIPSVIPELSLPSVPDLPTISKIDITKEIKNEDKKDSKDHTTINITNQNSGLNESRMPSIRNTSNSSNVNSSNLTNTNNINNQPKYDMFVVKGNGPNSRPQKINNSKNDFILFDGSSLSVREVDNQQIQVSRISNLENTITEGKVLEAVLETAINSELPGTVRAVISKDAIGEIGDKIIVPAGSRLYGSYTTNASYADTRVAIVWNKILRPDGVVLQIDANVSDQFGRAGIEGDVDSKYMQMFQNGLLLSFITLATSVALEKVAGVTGQTQTVGLNTGTVSTTNMTPTNMAVQSIITTATDIAKKMTEKLIEQIKPTISIPHGTLLKVMVNKNITATEYRRKVYIDR